MKEKGARFLKDSLPSLYYQQRACFAVQSMLVGGVVVKICFDENPGHCEHS